MSSEPKTRIPLDINSAPLTGSSLVEASAGTGKTFALAALYLRLVIEKGLAVERILVVTFTEAATAELAGRIRARLAEAAAHLGGKATALADPVLEAILARVPAETARQRVQAALRNFDLAAISTIHGFCRAMLADHPFESGRPFHDDIVTDEKKLVDEAVNDFFRRHVQCAPPAVARFLITKKLLENLKELAGLRQRHPLLHHAATGPGQDLAALERDFIAAAAKAGEDWRAKRDDITSLLMGQDALNGTSYSKKSMPKWFVSWDVYFGSPLPDPGGLKELDKCASGQMGVKKNCVEPSHEFFDRLAVMRSAREAFAASLDQHFINLKALFLTELGQTLRRAKDARNVMGYADMLSMLHGALTGPNGELLRQSLRQRFACALIDEFQDTDTQQYDIFRNIFACPTHTLYCIGDPKQAIYGFRGADVFAYLKATREAHSVLTQKVNYRADPGMIEAVNAVFGLASDPFVIAGIGHEKVSPRPGAAQRLAVDGEELAALCLWHVTREAAGLEPEEKFTFDAAKPLIAKAVAGEIARLLDLSARGKASLDGKALSPSHFAVLVRKHDEAKLIREELAALGIPSVRQQTDNIFETAEAGDLLRVLKAVASPTKDGLVMAALATDMLGFGPEDLDRLKDDDAALSAIQEELSSYRSQWASSGVMAAGMDLLAERKVRERLLALPDGERRLTNLLHCLEILHSREQEESFSLEDLLGWFSQAAAGEKTEEEELLLRLETDTPAVKVMTVFKCKGLEFDIVFCPFVAWNADTRLKGIVFHDQDRDFMPWAELDPARLKEADEAIVREKAAEYIRLFYVALTRAKSRCYLAWGAFHRGGDSPPGRLFHAGAKDLVPAQVASELETLPAKCPHICVIPLPAAPGPVYASPSADCPGGLAALPWTRAIDATFGVTSFSSLTRAAPQIEMFPGLGEIDLEPGPGQAAPPAPEPSPFAGLPRGPRAGVMYHAVFERMDFTAGGLPHLEAVARTELRRHGFDHDLAPEVALMARRCLDAKLVDGLTLGSITWGRRMSEAEFDLPLASVSKAALSRVYARWEKGFPAPFHKAAGELSFSPATGFLNGVMDLIVEHQGRFYLIDWKTNLLGTSARDYAPDRLSRAVTESWYFLQYHLYCLALTRHLRRALPGEWDFSRFGGVIYLFVRGVDPAVPGSGVFFDRPEQGFLDDLAGTILMDRPEALAPGGGHVPR